MSSLERAQTLTRAKRLLLAGLLSWGCAEVLGLEDPRPRPVQESGGASGQATGGVSGTDQGGTAGAGDDTGGNGDQGGTAGDPGGGTGGTSDGCLIGDRRCGGESSTTPEVCDDQRSWVVNDAENGGADCPELCESGACTECRDKERTCDGKELKHCEDGAWQTETTCTHYCRNGACENPPSCMSASTDACGGEGATCCSALEVPGGSFIRDYDNVTFTDASYEATLSSFLLDEFEVTVGRFRNFVEAYSSIRRSEGDGKADHIEDDTGWRTSYPMPATAEELMAQLACPGSTWTDDFDTRPINCVDFFVAYAFCIWDGGRLPTEAEWNRAAAGGNLQRVFPWSDPPGSTVLTPEHAAFGDSDPLPPPVGSKLGDGLWGHADLAGSLFEWTLDLYSDSYESTQCYDCLSVDGAMLGGLGYRSVRGGSFTHGQALLRVSNRESEREDEHQHYMGFRCARDLVTQSVD